MSKFVIQVYGNIIRTTHKNFKSLIQLYFRVKFRIFQKFNINLITSCYGIKLKSNYDDLTFKSYAIASYGFFYWKRILEINQKFIFIDIGANQGLYTICSTLNKNLKQAYAFEPVDKTFSFLSENIKLNQANQKCTLIKKGISDQTTTTYIKIPKNHSGAASLYNHTTQHENFVNEKIELISLKELDTLINQKEFPIYVKIDVEGHELTVIKELLKTNFANLITEIFSEIDENWVNVNEIITLLKNNGFSKFEKVGNGTHYDFLFMR
jgi:FkbM family methyltransferase